MILTCPACHTAFSVPDGAIPPAGRKVRCAQCGHRWHAHPSPPPAPDSDPASQQAAPQADPESSTESSSEPNSEPNSEPGPAPETEDMAAEPALAAESESAAQPDPAPPPADATASSAATEEPPDLAALIARGAGGTVEDFQAPAREQEAPAAVTDKVGAAAADATPPRKSGSGLARFLWILLFLMVAGAVAAFVFAPAQVRALWPASERLYDWLAEQNDVVRLRASADPASVPLTERPEQVSAGITSFHFEGSGPGAVLVFDGVVENGGAVAARVPRLAARLLAQDGAVLKHWEFEPEGRILPRGGRTHFRQSVSPVPRGAVHVAVAPVPGQYSARTAALQ